MNDELVHIRGADGKNLCDGRPYQIPNLTLLCKNQWCDGCLLAEKLLFSITPTNPWDEY